MSVLNLQDIWEDVLKKLEDELNPRVFSIWFSPIKCSKSTEDSLTLEVPNKFFKDWIIENYFERIQSEVRACANKEICIEFNVNSQDYKDEKPAVVSVSGADTKPVRLTEKFNTNSIKLNPQYTFDTFVIGSSNRFAHAACLAISESPAKAYNPLFLYGGVGLGKTHLMQAIGHYIIKKFPDQKILYVPSEKFTNQLIKAIQTRTTTAFREQYRSVDVLLIDDIQFIAGKEATQEEFFHTFNALYDAHKQIVVISDKPPSDISQLENRLISRFEWGLITDIQPPDFETRVAILRKKAQSSAVDVPDDILYFIAENITSNIRQLEGALIRVVAYASLMGTNFTVQAAREILKDLIQEHSVKSISIVDIQKIVCFNFNISTIEIKSKKRTKNIVLPRQIGMFLSRKLTSLSLPEIATGFGVKDHTTVLHACEKIEKEMSRKTELSRRIESIEKKICG